MNAGPPIAEVFRSLGVLCERPEGAHQEIATHLELAAWPRPGEAGGLFSVDLLPYAAIYLGPEGMLGGEAASRIAGFWRALGFEVPAEPDHLAALLGLYAALIEAEQDEPDRARALLRRQARETLLWEHLLTWVPAYAAAVAAAGRGHHADWAALLTETLLSEAAVLDAPRLPSAHLASVPGLPEPEDGVAEYVRAVLTPARSGIVLTRADLLRCARYVGLGVRIGERAFVLRHLLQADALGVLGYIEAQADEWARRHALLAEAVEVPARHWSTRARATSTAARRRIDGLQEVLADVR